MPNKELLFSVTLADCDVQTFRAGGPGGQRQDKVETAVRIIHRESGAVGESREERSQLQNKKTAFKRMAQHPKFTFWAHQKRKEIETGKTAEERVNEMMSPENIKVEVRKNGLWIDSESE
jgi:protein subunit release factor B